MPRVSPTVTALAIALALSLAGAGSAHAASTSPDAASERMARATVAANPGSVRLGPNRIQLEPGLIMTLPDRGSTKAARAITPCDEGYFCIYEDVGFQGASLAMSACKTYILHSYGFYEPERFVFWDRQASSWINSQRDAAARLWSDIGTWFRAPAWWARSYIGGSWDDRVVSVRPC